MVALLLLQLQYCYIFVLFYNNVQVISNLLFESFCFNGRHTLGYHQRIQISVFGERTGANDTQTGGKGYSIQLAQSTEGVFLYLGH